jgi:hypothetical protein
MRSYAINEAEHNEILDGYNDPDDDGFYGRHQAVCDNLDLRLKDLINPGDLNLCYDYFRRRMIILEVTRRLLQKVASECQTVIKSEMPPFCCSIAVYRETTLEGNEYMGRVIVTATSLAYESQLAALLESPASSRATSSCSQT